MYDLVIRNVRIVDGTGSPWRKGAVAIREGKIAAVGAVPETGAKTVDGQDHYLCPGFIDIHCHSDDTIFSYPQAESRILQGVTTELAGNCGSSAAPMLPSGERGYSSMQELLDGIDALSPSTNVAMLVGTGTLRAAAVGYDARPATRDEIRAMQRLAAKAMEEGAYGISSGLIYTPGSYADLEELIQVVSAVQPYGGFYATHMRNEKDRVVEAVEEALAIGRGAGVPVEISHHKVSYRPHWERSVKQTTALMEAARAEGLDVTCDQYPYQASATSLSINIPRWGFDGGVPKLMERLKYPDTRKRLRDECNESHRGRWDSIYVSYVGNEEYACASGKSIPEIAAALGDRDPAETVFDLVIAANNDVGEICFGMCEADIEYIMQKPYTMIGSDGCAYSLSAPGKPHPRNYGTFTRVLSHYARDRKLFSLEEAVRKMTAAPAARIGLGDRGTIKVGQWADLVLLDWENLRDDPTYIEPQQACTGILQVYVNGVLTAENGRHTGARAGKALRRGK